MNIKDDNRIHESSHELAGLIASRCEQDGPVEVAKGFFFAKLSEPTQPLHCVYTPSVCVIAQGAKEVLLGEDRFRYDERNCLLGSLDVPIVSQVVEASQEKPYLSVRLELDPSVIASVSVENGIVPTRAEPNVRTMAVSKLEFGLLDAFVRLVRLLDDPTDYRAVSPLVVREIIYRLLRTDQGPRLQQMSAFGGQSHRIARAVEVLRTRYREQLSIEELAGQLGMSASSFHQHFRSVTSMSPLQYQKQIRLQEARRLLLTEDVDASSAAARVGYEDASQFTREYKRLFGAPPTRDRERVRHLAASTHRD